MSSPIRAVSRSWNANLKVCLPTPHRRGFVLWERSGIATAARIESFGTPRKSNCSPEVEHPDRVGQCHLRISRDLLQPTATAQLHRNADPHRRRSARCLPTDCGMNSKMGSPGHIKASRIPGPIHGLGLSRTWRSLLAMPGTSAGNSLLQIIVYRPRCSKAVECQVRDSRSRRFAQPATLMGLPERLHCPEGCRFAPRPSIPTGGAVDVDG